MLYTKHIAGCISPDIDPVTSKAPKTTLKFTFSGHLNSTDPMPTYGPPIDEGILVRMLALPQYKMKSKDAMITLITHGLTILEQDERILDQHMITRSHFTLPSEDKQAVIAAAVYRRMAGYDDTRGVRNR